MPLCPCASGQEFEACCKPYLSGEAKAATAEALMRSRYSAFAVQQIPYLKQTLLPAVRDDFNEQAIAQWAAGARWTGLEVLDVQAGGPDDETGTVHFVARYEIRGTPQAFEERAAFQKEDGDWYYVDGDVKGASTVRRETPKVGRNDPCPCGSGQKFKKCCGK